jgi:hypothetical protein
VIDVHLAVGLPRVPASRHRLDARIARKVAPLFGVAGDRDDSDAGAGRRWFSSYSTLTMNEILAGGPQVFDDLPAGISEDTGIFQPKREHAPAGRKGRIIGGRLVPNPPKSRPARSLGTVGDEAISTASVKHFGPDVKAAVVLVGVNRTFEPIEEALTTVVRKLDLDHPGLGLATVALLLHEVFRSQPLLVLVGAQASRVQQANGLEADHVRLNIRAGTIPASRVEHQYLGRRTADQQEHVTDPEPDEDPTRPTRLRFVDEAWRAVLEGERFALQATTPTISPGNDANERVRLKRRSLAALSSLTEAVMFGLGDGIGGVEISLATTSDGLEAYVPSVGMRVVMSFVESLRGYFQLDDVWAPREASDVPDIPEFDISDWESKPELTVRCALLAWHFAHRCIESVLDPYERTEKRGGQRARLAEASAKLLGTDDRLTIQLDLHAATAQMSTFTELEVPDDQAHRTPTQQYVEAMTSFTDSLHQGIVDPVDYVETVEATISEYRVAVVRLGLPPDVLREIWTTQLQTRLALYGYTSEADLDQIVADLCNGSGHSTIDRVTRENVVLQCPYLWRSLASLGMIDLAFEFQRTLIALRRTVYEAEADFAPYRRALTGFVALAVDQQVATRAAAEAPVDRDEVVAMALRALVGHEGVDAHAVTRLSNSKSSRAKREAFGRVLRVLSDYLADADDELTVDGKRAAAIWDALVRYRDEIMLWLARRPTREPWSDRLRAQLAGLTTSD